MNLKCLFLGHRWDEWERLTLTQTGAADKFVGRIAQAMVDAGYRRRVCKRCGEWQSEFKKP